MPATTGSTPLILAIYYGHITYTSFTLTRGERYGGMIFSSPSSERYSHDPSSFYHCMQQTDNQDSLYRHNTRLDKCKSRVNIKTEDQT